MKSAGKLCTLLLFLCLCMAMAMPIAVFAEPEGQTEAGTQKETEAKKNEPPYKVVDEGGKKYLTETATGKKVTGKKGIARIGTGNDYYWFKNKKGEIYVKSWIRKKKKVYRAGTDGKLASGLTTIGKRTYYFKPSTHVRLENHWKKVDGAYYRFGKKGKRQYGFITLKGRTYYLDPDAAGARVTGWKQISGKWYYFNEKGRMQKGLIKIGGKTYYLSKKGIRKTGLRKISGKRYFFNKSTGVMQKGWLTYKSKTYYFTDSGSAVTGWLSSGGKKYYFNSSGVMQKGWLTMEGKKYYFDPSTGAMATGKQTISGKTYDFGKKGYIVVEIQGAYSIRVNQSTNVVTVYKGSTPVKAMLCSVGLGGATPNGTFSLGTKRHWHELFGGVWGQYTCVITGNILFHSVYYLGYRNNNSLATAEYYKLGSAASHGCVRLCCADAYYIYTNCPVGTKVTIGNFGNTDPLPRPKLRGLTGSFDPTDPNPND